MSRTRRRRDERTGDLLAYAGLAEPAPPEPPRLPEPVPARPCPGCGFLLAEGSVESCPQCGSAIRR